MLFPGSGEDEDVIHVDEDEVVEHVSEHVIDQGLEDSRSTGEAEAHYEVFIMPHGGVECCLSLVALSDGDQVVSIAKVKLREDGGPLEQFKGSCDERQGKTVLDGDVVQAPIVNARPQSLVFLFYEEETRPSWGQGGVYDACSQ